MSTKRDELRKRREYALKHCQERIDWYEKTKLQHRLLYQTLQVIAIILGALTPLLILLTDAKLTQAIVATLATIAVSLNGAFQWKESYVRFAFASEALKTAKVKFETSAHKSDADENRAIESFVNQIGKIVMEETLQWRKHKETVDEASKPSIPTD